jgi:hypothetical protein
MVVVATQAARYALTTTTVQNGDTVKQVDTGEMWFVIDQTNLNNAAGYSVYTAGSASAVPLSGVTGLGTGVSTALGTAVGSAGAPLVNGGVLGTPTSGTLTNATGLPPAGVVGTALVAAAIGTTVQAYNINLTAINQALTTTSSPSFTNVTASLTGNASTATNVAYTGLTGTVPTWNQDTTGTASNVTGTVAIANGGTGATTALGALVALGERTSATGYAALPTGATVAGGTGVAGAIRHDSDLDAMVAWIGGVWKAIGGGATGGAGNYVFMENDQVVTADYTITAGKNAGSFGDVSIAVGKTVTIPAGSSWTITG